VSREEAAEEVRRTMNRAIRRLSWMEYGLLALNMVLAMAGGAIAALGIRSATDLAFRPTWVICSLFLFIIPGVIVFARDRRVYGARLGEPEDMSASQDTHNDEIE